jgi:lipoprotein NlpI/uncharacterized RDD family membrane protein YckC
VGVVLPAWRKSFLDGRHNLAALKKARIDVAEVIGITVVELCWIKTAIFIGAEQMSQSPAAQTQSVVEEVAARSGVWQLLWRRWLGAWVDFIVLLLLLVGSDYAFKSALDDNAILIGMAAAVAYFPLTEGLWGRSLGKVATGTVVVNKTGRAPGVLRAIVRTLLRLIEVNPFLVGGLPAGIAVAASKRRQRLGDMLAGTYVVRAKDLRNSSNSLVVTTDGPHSGSDVPATPEKTTRPFLKAFGCGVILLLVVFAIFSLQGDSAVYKSRVFAGYAFALLVPSLVTGLLAWRAGSSWRLWKLIAVYAAFAVPLVACWFMAEPEFLIRRGQVGSCFDQTSDTQARLKAGCADVLHSRGVALLTKGDLDGAIANFDQAIGLDAKHGRAFYSRGKAYRAKGDLDHAIADYSKAIELDPKNADAFSDRADARQLKEDFIGAFGDYEQAIRLDPNSFGAFANRAALHLKMGEFDQAVADCDRAIGLNAKLSRTYLMRGVANFYAGSSSKALADLNQANVLDPKDAYAAIWRDIVSQRSNLPGRLAEAITQLDMTTWPAPIIRLYLGNTTSGAMFAAADAPEVQNPQDRLCAARFYAGELALRQAAKDEAVRLFRLAAAGCQKDFVEWSAANAELKALGAQQ